MKQEDKIRKYRLGLAQIPLLLVLLVLAVAVPVATKLVQQNQETRRGATNCAELTNREDGCICVLSDQCTSGSCLDALCVPKNSGGGRCTVPQNCESGNCAVFVNKCYPFPDGQNCLLDVDCQSGSCQKGVCGPKVGPGERCWDDSTCISGHCTTLTNLCWPVPNGKACTIADECDSGHCAGSPNGTCQPKLSGGESCIDNSACWSNRCVTTIAGRTWRKCVPLENGDVCADDSECVSENCAGGVIKTCQEGTNVCARSSGRPDGCKCDNQSQCSSDGCLSSHYCGVPGSVDCGNSCMIHFPGGGGTLGIDLCKADMHCSSNSELCRRNDLLSCAQDNCAGFYERGNGCSCTVFTQCASNHCEGGECVKGDIPKGSTPTPTTPAGGNGSCPRAGGTSCEQDYPQSCTTSGGQSGTQLCHKQGCVDSTVGGGCTWEAGSYCDNCEPGVAATAAPGPGHHLCPNAQGVAGAACCDNNNNYIDWSNCAGDAGGGGGGVTTPTCNTSAVTLSVAPGTVAANTAVTFNINGSASTYVGDNYGGGASGCTGNWNSKACTSSATAGTYTWTHTWKNCVGDVNNCSGTCTKSVSYVVSAPTIAKTCSIVSATVSGNSVTVNYSGRGNTTSELVRLWLEKTDGSVFATLPGGNEGTYPNPQDPNAKNAIRGGTCTTGANGATCTQTKTFTGLSAGNYYLHCDLNTDPKCSGNPFCDYEKPQKPGGNVCTGWTSCSTSDNGSFTIAETETLSKFSPGTCNKDTGNYTCAASATGFDTAAACQASTGCDIAYAPVAGSCNTTTGDWTCAPSTTGTFNTDALCKASTGCDVATSTDLVLKYRMAFAGLKLGAKCAVDWTSNLIVKGGNQEKTYSGLVAVKTTEANSHGDMIYKVEKGLTGFTQRTGVAAFIKGIKHLQMKYGKDDQTSSYGKAGGELTLKVAGATDHTVYNFAEYPLLAGDVNQDGVINAVDFAMVKAKASTYASVVDGGYLLEDLDGSCQVNTADITLLVKSLDEKQAELY